MGDAMLMDWLYSLQDTFIFYRVQILGATAAALVALVVGVVFWDDVFGDPPTTTACMLLDVSGSTRSARPRYSQLSRQILHTQSEANGRACAIVVKGDPAAQSDIKYFDVAPDNPDNSSDAPIERAAKQTEAATAIDSLLQHPPQTIGGSALVEALNIVARQVKPGESIHVFSDGLQVSPNFTIYDLNASNFSDQAIDATLSSLNAKGLIPNLAGVNVRFETPGYHPSGDRPVKVTDENAHKFWEKWAARTQANLSWGVAPPA